MTKNRIHDVVLRGFAAWLRAEGRSPKTIKAYQRDLNLLTKALAPGTLLEANRPALTRALASPLIQNKEGALPRAPKSIQRLKAATKSFFNWAEAEERISKNPARFIKIRRVPQSLPRFLSGKETQKLLKELRGSTGFAAFRDRVVIELFLGTGIRLQELVGLDVDHVELDKKHLRVTAKGGSEQIKFVKTNLRTLLQRFLRERRRHAGGPHGPLFLSNRGTRISPGQVENRVKHWGRKAGISGPLSPHVFRHTFGTQLYRETGKLALVQKALGHADIATTTIYLHLVDEELEGALERL